MVPKWSSILFDWRKNNIDDIIKFAEEITNEKFIMQGE